MNIFGYTNPTDKLKNGIIRLLDTHDIQHKRVEEFASRGMMFPLQITRDEERRIFNQFDAVIAIQAVEAEVIREMCPQLRGADCRFVGIFRECCIDPPGGRAHTLCRRL